MSCGYIIPYGAHRGFSCPHNNCQLHSKIIPGLTLELSQLFMTFLQEITDVDTLNDEYLIRLTQSCSEEFRSFYRDQDTESREELYSAIVASLDQDGIEHD